MLSRYVWKGLYSNCKASHLYKLHHMLQIKITHNHRGMWHVYIHFPNRLRHRAFLLLVSWTMSRTSPWVTCRSFPPGFFMLLLGSTIMVCSTLRGPSYWETILQWSIFPHFLNCLSGGTVTCCKWKILITVGCMWSFSRIHLVLFFLYIRPFGQIVQKHIINIQYKHLISLLCWWHSASFTKAK